MADDVVYLGDVPGPDAILPSNDEVLPDAPSVLEVNGVGELSVNDVGLGDPTSWQTSAQDPFAFQIGSEGQAGNDPQAKLYAPSYGSSDSGGSMYTGSSDGSAPITAPGGATYIGAPVDGFDQEQLANAQTIVEAGKKVGATDRDIQIAIMVGLVESNLHNVTYGDRDSVGVFQQRDDWGSSEDRLNVAKSAEMFFLGGQDGQQGLLDIPDREKRGMGELAQDVQVSAFPDRYAEREAEASQILGSVSGTETAGSYKGKDPYGLTQFDGETVDYLTAAALDAAKKEFGGDFGIMQGSHSHDVAASGNTHAGGGVVDLSVSNGDWEGAVAALRKIGFAAWARSIPGHGYAGSGAHIHAVLIGNEQLSPQAQVQVQSYLNNDDGLSGSRPDDGPRDYVNNRFVWGDALKEKEAWRDTVKVDAEKFIGTDFQWGGEGYTGADSPGFVRKVYKNLGVELPKTSFGLTYAADPIDVGALKPGDLIAWEKHPTLGSDHFGIYLGDGRYIDGRPGGVFQINLLEDSTDAFGIPLGNVMKPPGTYDVPAEPQAPAYQAPSYATPATPPNKYAGDVGPSTPAKPVPAKPDPVDPDPPPNKFAGDMGPGSR